MTPLPLSPPPPSQFAAHYQVYQDEISGTPLVPVESELSWATTRGTDRNQLFHRRGCLTGKSGMYSLYFHDTHSWDLLKSQPSYILNTRTHDSNFLDEYQSLIAQAGFSFSLLRSHNDALKAHQAYSSNSATLTLLLMKSCHHRPREELQLIYLKI